MHRFIIPNALTPGKMVLTDHQLVHQIKDVLRFRVGEKIIISNGAGKEAEVEILELDKKQMMVSVSSVRDNKAETARQVTLYCAILKKENFEWVIQKVVEVGVKKIVPVVTARTVKTALNLARLKKIAKEAAEQSGRGVVPVVEAPVELEKVVKNLPDNQANIFCHFDGEKVGSEDIKEATGIWIGPEGGWTEEEVRLAREKGFKVVSLGSTILRAETAATVGSFVAVNL